MDLKDDKKLLGISKRHLRNKRKAIRGPRSAMRKWKIGEERVILEYFRNVVRQNLEVEKPTADVFYAKLIEDLNLDDVSPTQAKNKVRHMRESYVRAVKWMQQNKQDANSSWGRQCLLEMCTHFDILSEIYANKLKKLSAEKPKLYATLRDPDAEPVEEADEQHEDEDSAREFHNYEPDGDSDVSNLPLKRSSSDYGEHPQHIQKTNSKAEGHSDESLNCFKQFLTTTSEAINRAFPSPAPSLASDPPRSSQQPKRHSDPISIVTEREANSSYEARWKMEEIKLQHEKLQMEKQQQEWERDIKEKELEVRKKEIETNERLRILEIEKEERMEKFKIEQECKLKLELANIKHAQSS